EAMSALGAARYLQFAKRAVVRDGPPIHLTLYVTGRCNARCRHCFHWKEVDAGVEGLPLAAMERVAATIGGELLWLAFAGGEPFLREDLGEIARAFARTRPRHVSIPTNALVEEITVGGAERVCAAVPDAFVNVSVSFDGPREIHDRIRAVPGGFDRSIETLAALRALQKRRANLGVGVIFTVTAENQDGAAEFVTWLRRELRPDNVTINLARGGPRDLALLKVDPAKYRAAVEAKTRDLRDGSLPYFRFPMARVAAARDLVMYERIEGHARGDGDYRPCLAGRLSAVVYEDGRVAPCEILPDDFGNLRDVDFDLGRLWTSPRAQSLRDRIWAEKCACTWECQAGVNVLFTPSLYPRLAAKTLVR
ncbi:MAG TPA: radical SAM protein, partial [Planctomycetota bacterium]|nr:radical SAM protein [Planctomycetota bacterium]